MNNINIEEKFVQRKDLNIIDEYINNKLTKYENELEDIKQKIMSTNS